MPSKSVMMQDMKINQIKKRMETLITLDDAESELADIGAGNKQMAQNLETKVNERYTWEKQRIMEEIKKENLIMMEQRENRAANIDDLNKEMAALDKRYHAIKNMIYIINKG